MSYFKYDKLLCKEAGQEEDHFIDFMYCYVLISKETHFVLTAEQRRDGQYLDIGSFLRKTYYCKIVAIMYPPITKWSNSIS